MKLGIIWGLHVIEQELDIYLSPREELISSALFLLGIWKYDSGLLHPLFSGLVLLFHAIKILGKLLVMYFKGQTKYFVIEIFLFTYCFFCIVYDIKWCHPDNFRYLHATWHVASSIGYFLIIKEAENYQEFKIKKSP